MPRKVLAVSRPYTLRFRYYDGGAYPLTSEDAQRLIDTTPIIKCDENRVVFRNDDNTTCELVPATLGGGPAFVLV